MLPSILGSEAYLGFYVGECPMFQKILWRASKRKKKNQLIYLKYFILNNQLYTLIIPI
jgi:hypothetical protein